MRVDQGSEFLSRKFYNNCNSLEIYVKAFPIESSNSLGLGERFHDPLRRIYIKVQEETPQLDDDLKLSLSYKAMNNTLGPEGIVPTLLVYGMMPRLLLGVTRLSTPTQVQRMKALSVVHSEMEQIVATLRFRTAVCRNLPSSLLDFSVSPGLLVMVCLNDSKFWEGTFELSKIEKRVPISSMIMNRRNHSM